MISPLSSYKPSIYIWEVDKKKHTRKYCVFFSPHQKNKIDICANSNNSSPLSIYLPLPSFDLIKKNSSLFFSLFLLFSFRFYYHHMLEKPEGKKMLNIYANLMMIIFLFIIRLLWNLRVKIYLIVASKHSWKQRMKNFQGGKKKYSDNFHDNLLKRKARRVFLFCRDKKNEKSKKNICLSQISFFSFQPRTYTEEQKNV